MDHRHNVIDNEDFERQSPPNDQAQQGSAQQNLLFDEFGYGSNDFMIDDHDHVAQDAFRTQHNDWSMMFNEEATSGPIDFDADADLENHGGHGNAPPCNEFQGSGPPNIFSHVGIPGTQQTIANPTHDSVDPHRHLAYPQFESANLTDRPLYGYANDNYNNQGHTAYTAPLPGPKNSFPMNSTFGGSKAQPSHSVPSPTPPNLPKRLKRRRRTSVDSTEPSEASRMKKQCAGCDKTFYTSKDPDGLRCSRCYDKHVKHTAGHTTYVFDPNMTIEFAWRQLYPHIEPLAPAGDDVDAARANEQDYIRRLIEAVSLPYTTDYSGSKEDQQRVAQQLKLNKKPYDSPQYRDHLVNARIRFLFHIAFSYHAGGPSLYDTGGDNSGYGEDRTMKFSERIERITQLLTLDKDIAMDVIEGRGVTALVHNPNKYERRKRDNKKSNDTKQDLQEKGKQLDMLHVGASASPAPPNEPALGQSSMSLHAQLSGNHGGSFDGFGGVSSPDLARLGMSGQSKEDTGDAGGPDEYEGYVPA